MIERKIIYRGNEFKFYNELMALRQELTDDFLKTHPEFNGLTELEILPPHTPGKMKGAMLFYNYDPEQMDYKNFSLDVTNKSVVKIADNVETMYPTAWNKIIKQFPEITQAGYSVLYPHSVIRRHTGPENRSGKYIRVHIPVIVPNGDIGFEVAGEEVDWSDLFAFDNQRVHSAWNNTDHHRVVFIIDLPRSICDLPDGTPWAWELDEHTPAFPKGEKPLKEIHENI